MPRQKAEIRPQPCDAEPTILQISESASETAYALVWRMWHPGAAMVVVFWENKRYFEAQTKFTKLEVTEGTKSWEEAAEAFRKLNSEHIVGEIEGEKNGVKYVTFEVVAEGSGMERVPLRQRELPRRPTDWDANRPESVLGERK